MDRVLNRSKQCKKNKNRVQRHREIKRVINREKEEIRRLEELQRKTNSQQALSKQSEQISENRIISSEEKLRHWALSYNVTRRTVDELLKILKGIGVNWLSTNSRRLCKTPRKTAVIPLANGKFWYHGVETNLRSIFSELNDNIVVELNFNDDGVPLFKSSATEFWPILANIHS